MNNTDLAQLLSKTLFLVGILFLTGCSSTTTVQKSIPLPLLYFPSDVMTEGLDIVDMQLTLADRNLYLARNGTIKLLSTAQCKLDISAHRGDFREPENSVQAISSALSDNFNSVEIDIMQLKDGTWVNHHDSQTGRATVYYSGERFKLEKMNLKQFSGLKLRDKDNNDLINQRPITAYEAFITFAANRKPQQTLNVEIKSQATGAELAELDALLRQVIGFNGFYYSSTDIDTLYKLRGINPFVYLGFVQKAHPSSVNKLRSDLRKGAKDDAYYIDNKNRIELAGEYSSKYYRNRYKDHTSTKRINALFKTLGANSGLHLDIRSYMQNPSVKSRANKHAMKIYTYTINGSSYHQSQLVSLKKTQLPNGVIVDETPYKICQRLFTASIPKKIYQPLTETGKYIASLPVDADFDRFTEMLGYQYEGYYLSLSADLKAINSRPPKKIKQTAPSQHNDYDFPIIVDQAVDTHSSATIILTLPSNNND